MTVMLCGCSKNLVGIRALLTDLITFACLLVSSPFLFRGTRVWIFCSRLRTLARISDTICTPLFLAKDPEDEVLSRWTHEATSRWGKASKAERLNG